MKSTKGITLIALIITIIILLILTGVTMNIAVNGGLFNNAQRAVDDTNAKVSSTHGVLDDVASQRDEHNWYRAGDNLTCSHCGLSFVIGDCLGYEPDATSQTVTITAEEAGDPNVYIDYESTLVSYSTDKESTVTTTEIKETISNPQVVQTMTSARPTTQTFTQETGNYWRVLGIEDSDGNGTNETLLIKMASPTSTSLYLGGLESYNNGTDILNKICKELYSSSRYGEARSIKIEDVNNCFQYKPTGGMYYYNYSPYETNGFNTQIKNLPMWNEIKANGTYTPDETNTEEKLGAYKVDGYQYYLSGAYYIINPATKVRTYVSLNELFTVFLDVNGDLLPYWLATKGVLVEENYVYFSTGFVVGPFGGPQVIAGGINYSSTGEGLGVQMGICPVVCLKDEIPPKINAPEIIRPVE